MLRADPADLLASAGDLLALLGGLTGDRRFAHARGILAGRPAGRPATDDGAALEYARALFDAGLARSKNAACLKSAYMYSATAGQVDATRKRLAKKMSRN